MTIINTRIDERLIHGQVATMWTNTLRAERIMVVDDDVIKNEVEKKVLKMAKPNSVKLSILSVAGASRNIQSGKYDKERVFLIVKKPVVLLEMVKNGVDLPQINVGNMSSKKNSKQVAKSISVTAEDVLAFKELDQLGVKLVAQMIPTDEEKIFMNLIG